MPGALTRFRIEGLHNRHTIDIPIEDNKLVLIGENGTGKSTVTNFIYFFLTQQWGKLLAYEFERILAVVNSEEIEITKEEISKSMHSNPQRLLRTMSPTTRRRFMNIVEKYPVEELLSRQSEIVRQAATLLNIPSSIVIEYLVSLTEEPFLLPGSLEKSAQNLSSSIAEKVLYLPTYRRIEQDLASIIPELASSLEFRNYMERWKHRARGSGYIELVEFGMDDVEETIKHKMSELKDNWRDDLNRLTGTYLRDVIQGVYQSAKPSEISELDESTIDLIFNRIDPSVLPKAEQKTLREIVAKIRIENEIQNEDKVIVHFLTRLIKLHKNQQEKEKDVRKFVDVCNGYLSGKEFIYDNMNFVTPIIQYDKTDNERQEGTPRTPRTIEMRMLSSGEKQIVSLFSQIYLSDSSSYFVIIDEPELSLSVFWQKRFLPDILKTGRCDGLIAVTHSPFICENELDNYMRPLERFMEPYNDLH